jgi:hypothetical protein
MIHQPQPSLFQNDTLVPFGVYDELIPDVDTRHWDKQGFLGNRRRTERKAWIYMGVYSPDLICGFAIADAGMVATAFAYFYSFKDSVFEENKITAPLGFPTGFNPNLNSEWRLGNYLIKTSNGRLSFQYTGKFKMYIEAENPSGGVSIVAPSGEKRPFNFTYKNLCMPVKVQVNNGGINTYAVSGKYGSIDFTKGYPPRETTWNWLSFIGNTETQKSIAVNLVDQFNGNMENILWVDGEKTQLSTAVFSMQEPYDKTDWLIETRDGILNCHLSPRGARSENINALLLKSRFIQPFGTVDGTVVINGVQERFTAVGVVEDHLAVW